MLPDEVVSAVSVVLRDTWMGIGVTGICTSIIAKPTCSTGSQM